MSIPGSTIRRIILVSLPLVAAGSGWAAVETARYALSDETEARAMASESILEGTLTTVLALCAAEVALAAAILGAAAVLAACVREAETCP